ncbi:MAG: carbohydrate-binding protein, partial [Fibrobacter sp.]|nr:carbohydrate-binding protein [Fibrobacter sp.]
TTGLATGDVTPVEPVPQEPFKGSPIAIPGKVEVEDFDKPGQGKNEDGSSNASYGDDSENHGDSDYRKDTGADLYKKATGVALGYNQEGDWYEWTVNVAKAGDYTVFASVATENSTSSFSLSVDGKVAVEKVALSGSSFDDFSNVKANINLPAGKHILRMDVTSSWFDIDYFNFVEGKDAADPENKGNDNPGQGGDNPGQGGDKPGQAIQTKIHMEIPVLGAYDVFDVNGVRLGRMRAYTMDDAVQILKTTSEIKTQGIYLLRSVKNGAVKSVRIAR